MRLIRREKSHPHSKTDDRLIVLHPWLFDRKVGADGDAGHFRMFGGAFLHTWMTNYPTADYAHRRTWSLFDLVALVHVDDKDGTLKAKNPGWHLRRANVKPKLNFKKVDLYGQW